MKNLYVTLTIFISLSFGSLASAQSDDEARARELIVKIQKEMKKIDRLLLEADEIESQEALKEVNETLDELLKTDDMLESVAQEQRKVIDDIEELIRLTKYSRSSQSQSDQSGEPPEQPQSGGEGERQKDPEPEDLRQQDRPEQPEPSPGDAKPESGQPDSGKPEDGEEGNRRPPDPTGRFETDDTAGRWGLLPPKVAEMFQNLGSEQFPAKYRKLLEQYYYKVNQEKK